MLTAYERYKIRKAARTPEEQIAIDERIRLAEVNATPREKN